LAEYTLDLQKDKKLLLSIDDKLSIDVRRVLAGILRETINDIKKSLHESDDHIGWFYFHLRDLYSHLDSTTEYQDSLDAMNSLYEVTRKTSLIWCHEDKEGNKVYDGWAPLIGEISWFDGNWLMQYYVPITVCRYLRDNSVALWVLASLEKKQFPKIL
jgi:hypothetical protein